MINHWNWYNVNVLVLWYDMLMIIFFVPGYHLEIKCISFGTIILFFLYIY